MTRVIVCCGVGGVGKTTASAALALAYAMKGQRAVVLTIDPAKRLADALGLDQLGNEARAVDLTAIGASGTLHALMLDRKATFDDLVRRYAQDEETAARLLTNAYYTAVSTRLTGSHEFMATEKLQQLVESGRWDVVVLDTPPAQHALEFFRAPERVNKLFDPTVLSVLSAGRKGIFGLATRQVSKLLERMAGESVISDIGEFFRLISGLATALRERSAAVYTMLRSSQASFWLVTPPRLDAVPDVAAFTDALKTEHMVLAGLIVNRVILPPRLLAPITRDRLPPVPSDADSAAWKSLSAALVELPERVEALARIQTAAIGKLSLAAGGVPAAVLPEVAGGVRTLDALARIVPFIPT